MHVRSIQHDSPEYRQMLELRNRMLRIPLGLDVYADDLTGESDQLHYGLFDDDALVACAIALPESDTHVKIRQMAVDTSQQGNGCGRLLLTAVHADLETRGVETLTLAARIEAVGFYQKLGYEEVGEEFLELGIAHQQMQKRLA